MGVPSSLRAALAQAFAARVPSAALSHSHMVLGDPQAVASPGSSGTVSGRDSGPQVASPLAGVVGLTGTTSS